MNVKAPASVLRLTQRWQDSALSALISTTRPSVTSKQAMPMLPLQHKIGALHCNWKVLFTANGSCPSGHGERVLDCKWKVPFRAWRKAPSQQMESALQGMEKGPFPANGRHKWHCTVTICQKTVYLGQCDKGGIKSFPISCMLIRDYTAG